MKKLIILFLIIGCINNNELIFDNNVNVSIEAVSSPQKMKKGLMNRESLCENCGMLFIYDEAPKQVSFWMKNTTIPLEAIWINEEKKVIEITSMNPCENDPCPSYKSPGIVSYVLEVNQGWSEKNNIKKGNYLKIIKYSSS